MKYIMLERKLDHGMVQKLPIIFPNDLVHAGVATALLELLKKDKFEAKVVSAGDLCLIGVTVGGSSTSLGLASNPVDELLITINDYAHGLEDRDEKKD